MINKLLVVGTMAYDAIETPFDKVNKILGGSTTYTALAASKFEIDCGVVSVVGDDFEKKNLNLLKNNSINCDGVKIVKNAKTFFWSGKYHLNMNDRTTIETQVNVLANFNPIIPKYYLNAKVAVIGNLDPNIQLESLNQIKNSADFILLDTMNFWIEKNRDVLNEVIGKVNLISVNDEEAKLLTNTNSLLKAASLIQKMGPQYVIIKKGEHGSMLFGEGKIFIIPAYPIFNVVDPTGAGDSFAGGVSGFLCDKKKINFDLIKQAMLYGSVLASFTVESLGIDSLEKVTKNTLNKRLNDFKSITSF